MNAMPFSFMQALVDIAHSLNFQKWIRNKHWLSSTPFCEWYNTSIFFLQPPSTLVLLFCTIYVHCLGRG